MAVIEARDVMVYLDGRPVSGPATFTAEPGETLMIVGPNGAGKTSLLRAIAGLGGEVQGVLEVNGVPAYVPQSDLLLPWKTIRENIELALSGRDPPIDLDDLYSALGLKEHLDKYPRHASGGTRRKAAIARGLVMGASILLLDEPFTGVDAASLEVVLGIIRTLRERDITTIIVTHQVYLVARIADRALLLEPPPNGVTKIWTLRGLSKLERYNVAEEIVSTLARTRRAQAS